MSLENYGRYQLLKKLATGGMAQIYLARQVGPEGFEKVLVVKRILPHLAENEEFITMFLDEARIAARLNHPNVVQIFDLGAQDDSFFIAMEFIHGEDVRRVWKHADKVGKPLPVPLSCRIIIEACAGLDYAHKKLDAGGRPLNIVHRDISPQNILVSFEGGVKVVDFGIAKAADQATVTKSGVLKGKYSYMSPEQAAGQPIDCRSDIFALGVVLYELLTGTRLFKRATDIQTLNSVTECKVAPPSEVHDRVPKGLDAIVMKALAKDRTQRYGEARQLASALEGWLLAAGQSASTAVLADFMHDIYAERLAREAEEGRLLVETADASRQDDAPAERERATPSLDSMKRQTRSMRATQSAARPRSDAEPTAAERVPGRSGPQSRRSLERMKQVQPLPPRPVSNPEPRDAPTHTEASMPTQSSAASRASPVPLAGVAVLAVALVLLLGGLGYWLWGGPRLAQLELDSQPSAATVKRDGAELCTTPCSLELEPGPLALSVEKAGFAPAARALTLEATGRPVVILVTLAPLPASEPVAARPARLPVTFESEPPGASVTIDGQLAGSAPVSRELELGAAVEVQLELAGYLLTTERFTVTEGEPVRRFTLKPDRKPPNNGKTPALRPPPVGTDPKPPLAAAAGKGTVRFIVKPWADVECREAGIKDTTPFQDRSVPAGRYQCTFAHPEYPTQVRQVVVQANEMTKVQVNFLQ